MADRHVLLLGATGLVGRHLLSLLLEDTSIQRVTSLGRRPLDSTRDRIASDAKLDHRVVDFDSLAAHGDLFAVDQVFCALGTTIRKAGSRERFRVVDYDYPFAAASLGRKQGATHFLLVSAAGANARSLNFYARVKGELDDAVAALGYRSVTIARPSLLVGERQETRRGEELGSKLGFLFPAKWKPIRAESVARALVDAARTDSPGVRVLGSLEMRSAYEKA